MNNTALPLCIKTQKVVKKIIFQQLTTNAGVLNYVDASTTLNLAWFNALKANVDKSIRFYPTPEMKNVDTPKPEPKMEIWKDGSEFFVSELARKFSGIFPATPAMFKGALEAARCNNGLGVYLIDVEGNLIGLDPTVGTTGTPGTKLYPIPINAQSVCAELVFGNDDNTQQIKLAFQFPQKISDAQFSMIDGAAFPDFDITSVSGLLNVNIVVTPTPTDTSAVLVITTPSPDLSAPVAVTGLVAANFTGHTGVASKIYNSAAAADVTVSAVVESPAGTYTLTYISTAVGTMVPRVSELVGYDSTNQKTTFVTP